MTPEELLSIDARKVRRLQLIVDFAKNLLYQTDEGIERDFALVDSVRKNSISLFPDNELTFFMIYYPRLLRVLVEKYGIEAEYYSHPLNIKFEEFFGGGKNANIQ